ncbi:MAG: pyruvate kinase [Nanoarchaeota archaeon]|nr:hypothetical protein [Nanoarchaeota archaeon]MBU1030979.1 hypothetical protein [Nanoarchaeota archaeon]MBU1850128.1 hypothetical protein [Nanoarchaeota archaeon]
MINAIVTIPPYAPFIKEVLAQPIVSGIRLNTVMPFQEPLEILVGRLSNEAKSFGKQLWIDLKCRQLRVKTFGVPPFTEIELTHNIEVNTPVKAYFSDGEESAMILKVKDNKLIMQDGPKRVVGPGESVNIIDPSLKVKDYFTALDKDYISAAMKVGVHNYMLSFVESQTDIDSLYKLDSDANIIAKIESEKGLGYVRNDWDKKTHLMAARGDLYVESRLPHQIIRNTELIVKTDSGAFVASRIFNSLSRSLEPSCSDIGDVDNLMRMGYETFMLGDDICQKRDSVISGLNLLSAMANYHEGPKIFW